MMRDFFKGVRKHIDRLDESKLREQYMLLSQELANLDRIFESMSEGVVFCDLKGDVTYENPSARAILGSSAGEAIARLGIPLDAPAKQEVSIAYPEQKFATIQVLPDERGTLIIVRDTTAERAAAEREMESGAFRAVGTLASGIAHEIGNPLNAISLSLQLLKRDPTDTETIDTCMAQVKRLDGIIRDFLAALRPQRPNLVPGSVVEPIRSCLAALKPQFEERQIRVTLDVTAALPVVALDKDKMEQVFFNLFKNALEAMKDGGTIAIDISADDRDVSIAVHDNGMGMDSAQIAHLFEPYRTSKAKGTGLGLMVSKQIVISHGGSIAAASTPGEGTTFTVTLPRIERRIRALK